MKLLLFSHDPAYARAAIEAGVEGVIVDWEYRSKERRQAGFDTEINRGTCEDLAAMRAATPGRIICRINNSPQTRRDELRLACRLGADEILLPMVRSVAEVRDCLEALPAGHRLSVMAETMDALELAGDFGALPLARVYLGLNDLLINRGSGHLFSPLVDGTVERFRAGFGGQLSVAGVTHPAKGEPIPCRLLMGELARLGCDYGICRRSFRRDIPLEHLHAGIDAIRRQWLALQGRSEIERQADRRDFEAMVQRLVSGQGRAACA
jgi:hypothetical protein